MVAAARMCFFILEKKMKKTIFKSKNYKHIDKPVSIRGVERNVKNKEWVVKHGFYPFISYSINIRKYSKEVDDITNHHWKIKERPIKYASHIDRYIYQWYAHIFNNAYNNFCVEKGINKVAIAYRTCLKGKTNIEFTKIAYDFIKKSGDCYVLVSDFSKFFDYIEHNKLKEKLCEVLKVEKLDDDYYKVFMSMTKYAYIERDVIEKYLIANGIETFNSIKDNRSLFENIMWNKAKKDLKDNIKKHKEEYGIPQGSPLSGVFANIYMIDFDIYVNNYVKSKNGLYMRYSDDLIIIIPKSCVEGAKRIWDEIQYIKKEYPYLKMNIEKSSMYSYNHGSVLSLHDEIKGTKESANSIDFLGFSFDGKNIRFRDKTITKFYYKLYRKIDSMLEREANRIKKGKKRKTKIDKKQILDELNVKNIESRRFIDYLQRAKRVYPDEKYIVNFKKKTIDKIFVRFQK